MYIDYENIDAIIVKIINGSCTEEEKSAVEKWRKVADNNERYYQAMIQTDALIDETIVPAKINTEAAWTMVEKHVIKSQNNIRPLYRKDKSVARKWWMYVAAACFVGVLGLSVFRFITQTANENIFVTVNEPKSHFIKANIEVTMQPHTRLEKVPSSSNSYRLTGEASIDVRKANNNGDKLLILVDEARIEDIGTKFNVKHFEGSDSIVVTVQEGMVRFYTEKNKGITINAKESGIYKKKTQEFLKFDSGAQVKTFNYVFKNASLEEVAKRLEENFNKKVTFKNEGQRQCKLTVSFVGTNLPMTLEIISKTLDISITEVDGKIEISGNDCN